MTERMNVMNSFTRFTSFHCEGVGSVDRLSQTTEFDKRKRSKNTGLCSFGMPTPRSADGGKTAGEGESPHRRLSLYGRLKPFLSFRKRKERNGFKKRFYGSSTGNGAS